MLTRSRQDEGNGSKSRKISRINRGTTCEDLFGMHQIYCVFDARRRLFDCTRIQKIGKDENNTKFQHLWKSEHAHINFSFRTLKHKHIFGYLNEPTGTHFKNEHACGKSNDNVNKNTTGSDFKNKHANDKSNVNVNNNDDESGMLEETNVYSTSSSKSIISLSKSTSSSSQSYKRPLTDVEGNENVRVPKDSHDEYLNCYKIVKKWKIYLNNMLFHGATSLCLEDY